MRDTTSVILIEDINTILVASHFIHAFFFQFNKSINTTIRTPLSLMQVSKFYNFSPFTKGVQKKIETEKPEQKKFSFWFGYRSGGLKIQLTELKLNFLKKLKQKNKKIR